MKTVGIVCEYNPFHNGHKHQIDTLRKEGAQTVICAMSGNFTQRGEIAIADKYARAEMAIRCGADVVVELPFPFSSFSAEGFASAGVHILSSLGIDTLSFGSECGDTDLLRKAAETVMSEEFISAYRESNTGSAKSYFDILSRFLGDETKLLSNDILGISYICSIKKQKRDVDVFPVKRVGSQYNDTSLEKGTLPSATAIREAIKGDFNDLSALLGEHMPNDAISVLEKAKNHGFAPVFTDNAGREILSFFKLSSPEEICARAVFKSGGGRGVADDGCGIVERLCASAKNSSSYEEFIKKAYNSRYTDARVNRVILFSLFGVSDIFAKALPKSTFLLAANQKGREYLSHIRKNEVFPIITKPADAQNDDTLTDISRLADEFYASAMPKPQSDGFFVKKHPIIL